MPTSTRFVVSVHTLALIADSDGSPVRSDDLAVSVGTNAAVVRALLSRLSAAGLTSSQKGNGGGALLARSAHQITLLDIYLAVEDRAIFSFHRSQPNGPGSTGRHIVPILSKRLDLARDAMEQQLAVVTIQDIVDEIRQQDEEEIHSVE